MCLGLHLPVLLPNSSTNASSRPRIRSSSVGRPGGIGVYFPINSLAVDGRYAYVPDGSAGFVVLDLDACASEVVFADDFERGNASRWTYVMN